MRYEVSILDAVDAYAAEYQLCEIMGQKAIYTESLIDRHSVPDGYYAYDIRDPIGDGEICEIRNFIRHGRDGTFIICKPIDGADCGVVFTEEEMTLFGKTTTLNDYINSWRTIEDMLLDSYENETSCLISNKFCGGDYY